jgi:DNA repair protein RecO (recombination protein O)
MISFQWRYNVIMREYISEALILDKRESGHQDARYAIFTKKFGKMTAKAKSARKVASKLAGHLEPGTVARVRLIEKNGLQVVDALREGSILAGMESKPIQPSSGGEEESVRPALHDLSLLGRLLAEAEPEPFIWAMVQQGKFDWRSVVSSLGWDPGEAACSVCRASPVAGFSVACQDFFCARCAASIPRAELIVV